MGRWNCDSELIMWCIFVSLGHLNQVFLVLSAVSRHIPFWFILTCSFMWKAAWAQRQDKCSSLDRVKDSPSQNLSPGCVSDKCRSASWEVSLASLIHCHLTQVRFSEQWHLKQDHLNKKQRWGFSGRERGSGDAVCILLTPERAGSAGNHKVFLLRVNGLGYIFWRRIACFLICRMINISPLLKGCLEE